MVLYNALSTLQARYPNESITRSLSMFKIRGVFSGGTLASLFSVAELAPDEREDSEWRQTRMSLSCVRLPFTSAAMASWIGLQP